MRREKFDKYAQYYDMWCETLCQQYFNLEMNIEIVHFLNNNKTDVGKQDYGGLT